MTGIFPQLKVETTQKKTGPCPMWRGSAVATDDAIYITPGGSYYIYCYQVKEDTWTTHKAKCSQKDFALAVFNGEVLAIGGLSDDDHATNKVLTLQEENWREELPPLTQPRIDAAVVSTENFIISIGGFISSYGSPCDSVELFHAGDPAWTSLASLPIAADLPSATLIGELIYIMADREHGYFCTLNNKMKSLPPLTWQPLPPFPPKVTTTFTPSSCSLGGQLVIVASDGTIYQLLQGKWEECGHLSGEYRRHCLLVSPSTYTMVAMGAYSSGYDMFIVDLCCCVE